jgi:hypothetical protein
MHKLTQSPLELVIALAQLGVHTIISGMSCCNNHGHTLFICLDTIRASTANMTKLKQKRY